MRLEYFEMIDRVDAFDGERGHIEATAFVPERSPVFEGHFPTYPIVPGVLLLETMNHAAGFLVLGRTNWRKFPFFAGVKKAKFRSFVGPGAELSVTADLIHDGSGFTITEAKLRSGGKAIASAEITMMLMDFPSPAFEAEMRKRALTIGLPTNVVV